MGSWVSKVKVFPVSLSFYVCIVCVSLTVISNCGLSIFNKLIIICLQLRGLCPQTTRAVHLDPTGGLSSPRPHLVRPGKFLTTPVFIIYHSFQAINFF